MPIYEYACPDCGHEFERMQKMSDDPVRVCPACGEEKVRKLISRTAFALKGSGWYSDHYGLKGGGSSSGDSSSGGSSSGGSSSGGSSSGGSSGAGSSSGSSSSGDSSASS